MSAIVLMTNFNFSAWAVFLALLIFVWISLLIQKARSKNIRELTRAAESYARGDLTQKVFVEKDKDLEALARTMNRMTQFLRTRISDAENENTKLTAILHHMAEAVIACNRGGQILIANPSAEKILHLKKSDMIGRSLIEVTRNRKVDEMMHEAVSQQKTVSGEVEFSYPQKKVFKANAVGVAMNESGISGILVLDDTTELHRLENLRREFVANVSHELRTPLTSIHGFIETLLSGAFRDSERSEAFLRMMDEDAKRLTRLIDDLLELSKIESREISPRLETVDPCEEIGKVVAGLKPLLAEKKIILEDEISTRSWPKILADRDQLKQVLLNLLDNAVKFNREGGRIALTAETGGNKLKISVQDTGIGIPAPAIPRIFERFFRVDKARSREAGGTGLGLAIVKHIVEAHGGEVSCTSRPGTGSTFSFTLPLA